MGLTVTDGVPVYKEEKPKGKAQPKASLKRKTEPDVSEEKEAISDRLPKRVRQTADSDTLVSALSGIFHAIAASSKEPVTKALANQGLALIDDNAKPWVF